MWVNLEPIFTGGVWLMLTMIPVYFATRYEYERYIARHYGEVKDFSL